MKKYKFFLLFIAPFLLLEHSAMAQTDSGGQSQFRKIVSGLNFPEGPAWNGEAIYFSNVYGGSIFKIKGDSLLAFVPAGKDTSILRKPNGLTFFKDGSLFACEAALGKIVRIYPDGKMVSFASGFEGKKFNRPNDLAFNDKGDLYFSDPNAYDVNNRDGVIYKANITTGEISIAAKGLAFPNGIAFAADCRSVFVCESALNKVVKFSVDSLGAFTEKKDFIELPGGDPDGIALDVSGNLYVAHFGGGYLYVVSPKGKIIKKIKAPGKKPSNMEFGGYNMKTLYFTEDETNSVYKLENDIPGMVLFCMPK